MNTATYGLKTYAFVQVPMISCMLIDLDRAVNRTLLIGTKRISTISDVQYEKLAFFPN